MSLAKAIAENIGQITFLSLNTSKHYTDIETIPEEIKQKIEFIDVFIDTKIKAINALKNLLFSKFPYNAERFVSDDFKLKIKQTLTNNKFDIIQLEGLYLMPYVHVLRKYSNAKLSLRAHNIEHEIWQRTSEQETNFFKKKYLQNLTKRINKFEISSINKYDLLVPITQRDEGILNKLGNTKPSQTIPTGFDLQNCNETENNLIKQEFPSLFHIGALDWGPNQEGIIWFFNNCWGKIQEKEPNLKFYIAGRNAPKSFIQKIKQKNVIYCGEVESASQFMLSKALMLVPLLSGSGMRIKIIEGMALEKTIVSTSIGVEGIPATHKKNILIADNPDDFVKEIFNILSDKKLFTEIGKNAKKFILKNFDNQSISKFLIAFYEENS